MIAVARRWRDAQALLQLDHWFIHERP